MNPLPQRETTVCLSTAFGYETAVNPARWEVERPDLLEVVRSQDRRRIMEAGAEHMTSALGDTQRPINDVTLWDISHGVSALFKAALAGTVLTGAWLPIRAENRRWRFLCISYDGLNFLNRVNHVSDLLGRRDALEKALDEVQALIERNTRWATRCTATSTVASLWRRTCQTC